MGHVKWKGSNKRTSLAEVPWGVHIGMHDTVTKRALKDRLRLPVILVHIAAYRALLRSVRGVLILGDNAGLAKPRQQPIHPFGQILVTKIQLLHHYLRRVVYLLNTVEHPVDLVLQVIPQLSNPAVIPWAAHRQSLPLPVCSKQGDAVVVIQEPAHKIPAKQVPFVGSHCRDQTDVYAYFAGRRQASNSARGLPLSAAAGPSPASDGSPGSRGKPSGGSQQHCLAGVCECSTILRVFLKALYRITYF